MLLRFAQLIAGAILRGPVDPQEHPSWVSSAITHAATTANPAFVKGYRSRGRRDRPYEPLVVVDEQQIIITGWRRAGTSSWLGSRTSLF